MSTAAALSPATASDAVDPPSNEQQPTSPLSVVAVILGAISVTLLLSGCCCVLTMRYIRKRKRTKTISDNASRTSNALHPPPTLLSDHSEEHIDEYFTGIWEEPSTHRVSMRNENTQTHNTHKEPHFGGAQIMRDAVVGLSDGLTVPFALTAGLASLGDSRIVVLAGMAEIAAGSIAMGLGGYLAGRSEIEHYNAEESRELDEVLRIPDSEEEEVVDIMRPYGLDREDLEPLLRKLRRNPAQFVDLMMRFELGLEKPKKSRLWISALTIGGSYFLGGLVPLSSYLAIANAATALYVSAAATLLALFLFGFAKGKFVGVPSPWKSAMEMTLVGALAAGAAFGIAKLLPVQK
ncbi:hypothetical protein HDU81_001390 [Chytriomyces hyalinus]|nr:hypothetical protein HDU81_001390 [Chytriomyces hyalinus]